MSDPSASRSLPLFRRRAPLYCAVLAGFASAASSEAFAQTWQGANGASFGDATNWSPQAVPDGAHVATFGPAAAPLGVAVTGQLSVAGLVFAPGAAAFTLTLSNAGAQTQMLTLGPAGIRNNGAVLERLIASGANTALRVAGAGATVVGPVELSAVAPLASVAFGAGTNAGDAVLVATQGGQLSFTSASAAMAHVSVGAASQLSFANGADAGFATIANASGATTIFNGTSSAAAAHIANSGSLLFAGSATAAGAALDSSGVLTFANASTAGSALITNRASVTFQDNALAGQAVIANAAGASITFAAHSGAASSTLTNLGSITFQDQSDLGQALIRNLPGATLTVRDAAAGALATVTSSSGATVDISASAASVVLGSLSGGGSVELGARTLEIGALGRADTLSATISGAGGTLVKQGPGVLTLTGTSSYSGATVVGAGALVLDGAIDSPVTVDGAAQFGGSGLVHGALQLLPGSTLAVNANGPLRVDGDVALAANSRLAATLATPQAPAPLQVSGKATLSGAELLVIAPLAAAAYAPGEHFTLLDASQGVSGQFENLTSNLALFSPSLVYEGDRVVLELNRPAFNFGTGLTPNQQSVSAALGSDPSAGAALVGLSSAATRALLDQIAGTAFSDARRGDLDLSGLFLRRLSAHVATDEGLAAPGETGHDAWIEWQGAAAHVASDANASGFRSLTRGILAGARLFQSGGIEAEAAASLTRTALGFAAAGASGVADRWDVGAALRAQRGAWNALAAISVGQSEDQLDRSIAWPTGTEDHAAHFSTTTYSALAEVARPLVAGDWSVTPFADWQFLGARFGGFDETLPGAAALSGSAMRASSALTSVGLRLARELTSGAARSARVDASLTLAHQSGSRAPLVEEMFRESSDVRLAVTGPHAAPTWVRAGLELLEPLTSTVEIRASAQADANGSSSAQQVFLGLRMVW